MVDDILQSVVTIITSCFGWMEDVLDHVGALPLITGGFLIFCTYRFLLRPILGGSAGRSDRARSSASSSGGQGGGDSE